MSATPRHPSHIRATAPGPSDTPHPWPSPTPCALTGATPQVFERGELFRRHIGNLDLIVHMHNSVETTLLPVERPLLQQQLDRIDLLLSQGIGGESSKPPPPASSKSTAATKSGSGGGGSGGGGKGSKKKGGQNSPSSKKAAGKGANAPGGK